MSTGKYIFCAVLIILDVAAGVYLLSDNKHKPRPEPARILTDYEESLLNKMEDELMRAPINPEIHNAMADYYFPDKDFKDSHQALEYYLKVLEVSPKDPDLLRKIALLYFRFNNYPEAIHYSQKIIESDPSKTAGAYVLLADSYFDLKDFGKTVEYFDRLFQLDSHKPRKLIYSQRLGKAYYYLGRYQDTIQVFQLVPRLNQIPRERLSSLTADISGVAYFYLGLSYFKTGQYGAAKTGFQEALNFFTVSNTDWRKKEIEIIKLYLNKF